MKISGVNYILTDIEGTTTSVSFVYEVLFPYFRENLARIEELMHLSEVQVAIEEIKQITQKENGYSPTSFQEIKEILMEWSLADRKVTPLKTLQGILWAEGYKNGSISGHIYPDVPLKFESWKKSGLQIGIFSSGSVSAQKLLFGYSEAGDLTRYLSNYFDTRTGGKREVDTYTSIAKELELATSEILFLSDIQEELQAAMESGYKTIQLIRPGTDAKWSNTVKDFSEIEIDKNN